MKYATLPTSRGSVTLDVSRIAGIESTGEGTCNVHMRKANVPAAEADKFSHKGYGASEAHNTFKVIWPADDLRSAMDALDDGNHFDPLKLETLGDE